jgi:hypothetical protein
VTITKNYDVWAKNAYFGVVQLDQFIQDIFQQGKVVVDGIVSPFTEEDIQRSIQHLHEYYQRQQQELTGTIPDFHAGAAIWAAGFLYRSIQLVMLRDLGEDAVNGLLTPYDGGVTPETILSVDLSFRYLPNLMGLAKGLAPEDVLVKRLQEAAIRWPFSSVGMKVEGEMDIDVIMNNACLRRVYIDRIIETRDKKRCNNVQVNEDIQEALGDYGQMLWPGWEPELKEK